MLEREPSAVLNAGYDIVQQYLHLEALPDKLKSEDSACLPPAAPRVLLEDARESASSHPIRKDLFACLEGFVSDCVFVWRGRRVFISATTSRKVFRQGVMICL
jgi:hypothetical protein